MKYFVTADVHGFYDEFINALKTAGYFDCEEPKKLIICGDLFDRGCGALALQQFIVELMQKDEVILIRGNHEDLALRLLDGWDDKSYYQPHHNHNGTLDTFFQLTQSSFPDLVYHPDEIKSKMLQTPFIRQIIPSMLDYYETPNFVFVHGWLPSEFEKPNRYTLIDNWRKATKEQWGNSRWLNGMEAAYNGQTDKEKTVVCGHWHCSFGHSRYEHRGSEFESDADFSPYYAKGIIALDACTVVSRKVNCIVIED